MNRRNFVAQPAAFAAAGAMAATGLARADERCAVSTSESRAKLTPAQVVDMLREGNERFVAGKTINCDLRKLVIGTADGQAPMAAIVGCIDSRVPPEMVFDRLLGDIFAARIAGNFVNDDIIGSLEFTTKLAGAKAIVVLGHSECGAVKGAVDNAKLGLLTGVLAKIRPSLERLNYSGTHTSKDAVLVQRVADQNVRDAVAALKKRSAVLAQLVKEGKLTIVGAMHNIDTGKISWIA